MPQVQHADPTARKKAILLLAVGTVFGVLILSAIDWYQADFERWFIEGPEHPEGKFTWILIAFALVSLPLLFAGVYFWRMGRLVIDTQRFPPPGIPVIRDTPILSGKDAVVRGRIFQLGAFFLGGSGIVIPVILWWVLRRILGDL